MAPASSHGVGLLGEAFVAQWLQQRGYQVLAQRWHCRWGELDLIAQDPDGTVAFVEVKTRSRGSWDEGGLLAITPTKQRKLITTAQDYLAQTPAYQDAPCRFDVAAAIAVPCPRSAPSPERQTPPEAAVIAPIHLGQPHPFRGHHLTLQTYLANAFLAD
ncbi:MAG: YraN family protein [Cyanobacteria bacterium]|nr:YraN family protein [Cyanobacteriota bacterium]